MPTLSFRSKDGSFSEVAHVCFSFLPRYWNNPDTVNNVAYVMSTLSYCDTKLWADAVTKGLEKYRKWFKIKAHFHTTKIKPFKGRKINFWSVTFSEDCSKDLAYALLKYMFKNITYGSRTMGSGRKSASPQEVVDYIKQGASLHEALAASAYFNGNGYQYPVVMSKSTIHSVKKLLEEGPSWPQIPAGAGTFKSGFEWNMYHRNHNPIRNSAGYPVTKPSPTFEQFQQALEGMSQ